MLDGYLERRYDLRRANLRLLSMLNIIEIGADGDRGVVISGRNDRFGLLEYAATGIFAPVVTQEMQTFFGADAGTYMDVGANIGLTTIPFARNPRIRCLAFEPEPANFDRLKLNVARNAEGAAVEFHQVALFDTHGTMSMSIAETNLGDHRLTRGAVADRRTIQVPVVPLDDFPGRVEGRLAVKVDTQGAEPFIVAGRKGVFASCRCIDDKGRSGPGPAPCRLALPGGCGSGRNRCSGHRRQGLGAPSHRRRRLFGPAHVFGQAYGHRNEIPELRLKRDVDKGAGCHEHHQPGLHGIGHIGAPGQVGYVAGPAGQPAQAEHGPSDQANEQAQTDPALLAQHLEVDAFEGMAKHHMAIRKLETIDDEAIEAAAERMRHGVLNGPRPYQQPGQRGIVRGRIGNRADPIGP